jgi:hypothetical protein
MIDRLIENILEWAAGHADEGRYSPVGSSSTGPWRRWSSSSSGGAGGWVALPVGGDKVAAMTCTTRRRADAGAGHRPLELAAAGPRPHQRRRQARLGERRLPSSPTMAVLYLPAGPAADGLGDDLGDGAGAVTVLLGLIPWPLMPLQELDAVTAWRVEAVSEWMHWGLILILLLLIPIHVGAALKHQIIDRDDVFHGMLPVLPQPSPRRTRWRRRYRAVEKMIGSAARRLFGASPRPSGARRRRS